jgi:hypothetical protein
LFQFFRVNIHVAPQSSQSLPPDNRPLLHFERRDSRICLQ